MNLSHDDINTLTTIQAIRTTDEHAQNNEDADGIRHLELKLLFKRALQA